MVVARMRRFAKQITLSCTADSTILLQIESYTYQLRKDELFSTIKQIFTLIFAFYLTFSKKSSVFGQKQHKKRTKTRATDYTNRKNRLT